MFFSSAALDAVQPNSENLPLVGFVCQPSAWKVHRRPRPHLCHTQAQFSIASRPSRWTMASSTPLNCRSSVDHRIRDALAKQNVVVTGATGLIGRALVAQLRMADANVSVLARDPPAARSLFLDRSIKPVAVVRYKADTDALSEDACDAIAQADVVINLAGEPVEDGRWTRERKQILWNSRVKGTGKIAHALREKRSQAVLISASAVGYYGTTQSETQSFEEDSSPGTDFLATLAVAWENAALLNATNSRTVVFRMGVVLANGGGALEKMSMAFRYFLGGPPGGGSQWFSWVHIEDVVRLLLHASVDQKWEGVYNATAPQPVRLLQFCKELGRALGRPSWLPVPKQAVQALLGNEAAQLILAGQRVLPKRTLANGFIYRYKDVASALQQLTRSQQSQLSNTK